MSFLLDYQLIPSTYYFQRTAFALLLVAFVSAEEKANVAEKRDAKHADAPVADLQTDATSRCK